MLYKTEAHLHTSEGSKCGKLKAKEIVRLYKEKGFDTVFITNHFSAGRLEKWGGNEDWAGAIDRYMLGYRKGKEEGDRIGINVLFGAECKLAGRSEHYLVYGITEEFLKAHPGLASLELPEFSRLVRENGILLVQAHPFRDEKNEPFPEYVDGFEVYNVNPRHEAFNEKAEEVAAEYGLYRTAGSDAHRPEDIARTGMVSDFEIKTPEDYIALVKSRKAAFLRVEEE